MRAKNIIDEAKFDEWMARWHRGLLKISMSASDASASVSRSFVSDEDRILDRLRGLRSDLMGRVKHTGDGSVIEFRSERRATC